MEARPALEARLFGTPACRRYQRMRVWLTAEAARLGLSLDLSEINDMEQLSQFNPLSLPRLYLGKTLVASQNLPSPPDLEICLQKC